MNAYLQLKEKQQKEVDNFPMFFAFSDDQFKRGMEKIGLTPDDVEKVCSIGLGGFMKKTDVPAFNAMMDNRENELKAAIAADKDGTGFIYDMVFYELENHEYCITLDFSDTINALGLTREEIKNDPRMVAAFNNAARVIRSKEY